MLISLKSSLAYSVMNSPEKVIVQEKKLQYTWFKPNLTQNYIETDNLKKLD